MKKQNFRSEIAKYFIEKGSYSINYEKAKKDDAIKYYEYCPKKGIAI